MGAAAGGVENLHRRVGGAAGDERVPRRRKIFAQRRDRADAGHDNARRAIVGHGYSSRPR
jgi:hypothetical protein